MADLASFPHQDASVIPSPGADAAKPLDPSATFMFNEAAETAAVLRAQFARNREAMTTLGRMLRKLAPRAVISCARGSSDHAATFAKYLIETRAGVLTASAAPSVSSVYFAPQNLQRCLFLAISQSGRSPDLLATTRAAKDAGAFVVALVNEPDSPLAELADMALPLCAGKENSVAATKSYLASLAAIVHLVAEWTDDALLLASLADAPDLLERAWPLDWSQALPFLRGVEHLYVVGRGLGLGVAMEAALKCKETCGLHAEAFSSAEVLHGPQALLGPGFPALVLSQDDETRAGIVAVARQLMARGVDVVVAGAAIPGAMVLPTLAAHPVIEALLMTQSFYRLANDLSVSKGRNPDQPPHLRKITETR
jgi:glutamine---fructose-6-phosphate transaminase (isomerizing)